ncbi:tyrosine-type recombinase/integrase [Nocardia sp. SYP-A9097]|uniref:tyrosine-type recombinase/integrase n=1 Tax=Nocardia sp. SYP-A9097 TaxID=2663237 RepID=UPI0035C9088F
MTLPDAPEQLVEVPPDDALRQLLAECSGTGFNDLRDTAIIRMFADTGCRAGELAGLSLDDLDFTENTALVLGKGRRPRTADRTVWAGDLCRRIRAVGYGHRENPLPHPRSQAVVRGSSRAMRASWA